MKIANFKEFVKLPSGTVYQEWKPHYMTELKIKQKTLSSNNDFFFSNVTIQPSNPTEIDAENVIYKQDNFGFVHDNDQSRWGMYLPKQLFLIYHDEDVDKMIETLKNRKQYDK